MSPADSSAVFFDLATLGMERAAWNGQRMARFHTYPRVHRILETLRRRARLGVLATGSGLEPETLEKVLWATSLGDLLDPSLILAIRPGEKDPFERALRAAGLEGAPERCLYASLDAALRTRAVEARMRVAPHPAQVRSLLDGEELRYMRASARLADPGDSWAGIMERESILPVFVTREARPTLYAVAPLPAFDALGPSFAPPEPLGTADDVAKTNLYLLQVTPEELAASRELQAFLKQLQGQLSFVESTQNGWIVPIPGSRSLDEFHPPDAGHGQSCILLPDIGALQSPAVSGGFALRQLEASELSALAKLDACLYDQRLGACCGSQPLPTPSGAKLVKSRHVKHQGNADATSGLAMALKAICEKTFLIPFASLSGGELHNIEAEITGASGDLVIVGAHFDSTAERTPGFPGNEETWAAPGADDDASGVAGVLAAAEVLEALSQTSPPQRTIRFLLFNKEEYGRVGSKMYTSSLKQLDAPVVAMLQMDMIGWVGGPYPTTNQKGKFEVHGTGTDDYSRVYEPCAQLVELVKGAAPQVSPGLVAQTYPFGNSPTDPAAGRSDHSSFQYHDWPACLLAEDLWADLCQTPVPQTGNPAYHTQSDNIVHVGYAADVARVAAATAWILANPGAPAQGGGTPPITTTGGEAGEAGSTTTGSATTPETPTATSPVTTTNEVGGRGPMPQKFLVEFLAKWIRDKQFRCQVLHKEQTTLRNYGLTQYQIDDLMSLDKATIMKRLADELEKDLEIDLARVKKEVEGL